MLNTKKRKKDESSVKLKSKNKNVVGCITPQIEIEQPQVVLQTKGFVTKEERMEIEGEQPQMFSINAQFRSKLQSKDINPLKTDSMMYQSSHQSSIYFDFEDKSFLYQKTGDLYQLDDFYQFAKMQDSITLCIRFVDKIKHQLEIYGPNGKMLYVKVIEADTSYFIDLDEGIFKWIDIDDDVLRVLAFKLITDQTEALLELKNVLAHETTQEKRLEAGEYSVKMSPSSIHCSDVKTNLFEKYEEEFQQKIDRMESKFNS